MKIVAPLGARASADTVLLTFGPCIHARPALEKLITHWLTVMYSEALSVMDTTA